MQDLDVSGLSKALARPMVGATKGVVVVIFYANWCQHCTDTLPVFAEAKQILAATKHADALVQIDVAKHTDVAHKYDIKAYPTIRAFVRGQPVGTPYAGLRDAGDMAKWTRDIIANPPPPEDRPEDPRHPGAPQSDTDSMNGKGTRPIPRASTESKQPYARAEGADDEKLANALKSIGKRMADMERKRRDAKDSHSPDPDGPDDPDGLDEGWFPLGKREKGKGDADPKTFSADPLYGHSNEF